MRLTILLAIVMAIHANGHNVKRLESDMKVNEDGILQLGTVKRQWETLKLRQLPVAGNVAGLISWSN